MVPSAPTRPRTYAPSPPSPRPPSRLFADLFPESLAEGLQQPLAVGVLPAAQFQALRPGEPTEAAAALQPAGDPDRQAREVGLGGEPVVGVGQAELEFADFGAAEDAQPYRARSGRVGALEPDDHADDGDGDGGLDPFEQFGGLGQGGQVAGREVEDDPAVPEAARGPRGGGPGDGQPGRRRAADQVLHGLDEFPADSGLDGVLEGLGPPADPAVVDGVAQCLQGADQGGDGGPALGRGGVGGEGGALLDDQDAVQEVPGVGVQPGAEVGGRGPAGLGPGGEHRAGRPLEPLGVVPGGGLGGAGRFPVPTQFVAGDGQCEQDGSGGRGGGAGQRGDGVGEEVDGVVEAVPGGDEDAGAGLVVGRRPAAVAGGGAASPDPAVPGEQGGEHRRVDGGGVGQGLDRLAGCVRRCHGCCSSLPGAGTGAGGHGLPPAPTRAMMSQSARSSKTLPVGTRTLVRRCPVTGWPARLTQ